MSNSTRNETDSLGSIQVPADALYGAHTQRAVENFPISGQRLPAAFIRALGAVKAACARVNGALGELPADAATAIAQAADQVAAGEHDAHFPVDVFQTGSATSTNMNANEVIARLASQRLGREVHPNDDVNRGQSSNDVIPTAIHVAAAQACRNELLPALDALAQEIERRTAEFAGVVKTGRTHLMDAMPLTLGQELSAWAAQVRQGQDRVNGALERIHALAIGGTAVGTGINAHPQFGERVAGELAARTGIPFRVSDNRFLSLACQDAAVELSGQVRTVAVSLMKIANDLRWMNSGPLAGLAEISLPALQAGSSIMPGKVNPVIPEAVTMVCAQVIGHDTAITVAGQSGNFQLNVMLPLIAYDLVHGICWLAGAARVLGDRAIAGFTVNGERIQEQLSRNPILITALNARVGYDLGARIAKRAYAEGRAVIDVAAEMTELDRDELARLLDPARLTGEGPPD